MKTKGKDTGGVILQFTSIAKKNNLKVNIIKNMEKIIIKDSILIEEFISKMLMQERG